MENKKIEKELHDDFCILLIFLLCLVAGLIFGCFYHVAKGYGGVVKQGLDSYASVRLK